MEQLSQVLQATLSEEATVRRGAEQELQRLQSQPAFCEACLQYVVSSAPLQLRLSAAATFRRVVTRHWADLGEAERAQLRGRLLDLTRLPEPKLHTHDPNPSLSPCTISLFFPIYRYMAVSLARVVRQDFPAAWPGVIGDLRSRLEAERDALHVLSVLSSVREVVECLLEGEEEEKEKFERQQKQRLVFGAEARNLLELVARIWTDAHTQLLDLVAQYTRGTVTAAELGGVRASLLGRLSKGAAGLLRDLCRHYLTRFVMEDATSTYQLFARVHHYLGQSVAALRALGTQATPLTPDLEALVLRLQKMVCEAQEAHPHAMVPVLQPFVAWFDQELLAPPSPYPAELDGFWEKYVINLMNLLAQSFHCREYTRDFASSSSSFSSSGEPQLPSSTRTQLGLEACEQLEQRFTTSHLLHHVDQLLGRWLHLKPSTLQLWREAPEDVLQEEISDDYRNRVEPCAEFLFHRILAFGAADLPPALAEKLIETLQATAGRPEPAAILRRDAALNLLGLGYHTLGRAGGQPIIEFSSLFRQQLAPEFDENANGPLSHVLRRRVVHVVQHWSMAVPREVERDVYRMLVSSLRSQEDLLVRVYGALALRAMLDDFDFAGGEYLEFLAPSVEGLMDLVRTMSDSSTTVYLLDQVVHIVETMSEHVRPYMQHLVQLSQHLWAHSSSKAAVQAGIVRVLTKLVEELIGASAELEPALLPVIRHCCTPGSREAIMLQDEGLALWQVMVEQSAFISPALLGLAPNLLFVLKAAEDDVTVAELVLRILYAYVLNGKAQFLQAHATVFVECVRHIMRHARRGRLHVRALDLLTLVIRLFPQEGPQLLLQSELLVLSFRITVVERQARGQLDAAFVAGHELLCRLRVYSTDAFAAVFAALAGPGQDPTTPLLSWLQMVARCLDPRAVEHLECAAALVAGLAPFLVDAPPALLPDLPALVDLLSAIASDYQRRSTDRGKRRYKRRLHRFGSASPAKRVFAELKRKDPLRLDAVDPRGLVRERLRELCRKMGPMESQFLSALKPDTTRFLSD